MDTNTLTIVFVAVLVIAAIALARVMTGRRRQTGELKEQFGPEYEHAVEQYGDSHKAEAELQARQKRVGAFDFRPLAHGEFVDAPDKAVIDAHLLVQQVMQQRGYPMGDFKLRAADISVDRLNVLTHFERTSYILELLSTNPDMNNWRRTIAK